MSDAKKPSEPGEVWRNQPEDNTPVDLQQFARRRARELHESTRWEIIVSIAAALLLAAMIALRSGSAPVRFQYVAYAAIGAWVLISLYWFRDRIRSAPGIDAAAVAASGLEYYRRELIQRRDHLTNAWVWSGPLLLACLVLATILYSNVLPSFGRLRGAAPLILALGVWVIFGVIRRRRSARALQREIEELDRLAPGGR
jgi:hypothetical protein